MTCARCGAAAADDEAAYCSRCGAPLGDAAAPGSLEQRRELALEAFRKGRGPAGVQCPNCGGYRMQAIARDAEENLFWSSVAVGLGIVMLLVVVIWGDTGLFVANLSTIALIAILIGVVLFMVARWRRQPSAYECFDCNYRVP